MKNQLFTIASVVAVLLVGSFSESKAQTQESPLIQTILRQDSLFWITYNQCDTESMKQFVYDDLEFYHDKGGITLGKIDFIASVKNNLCSNSDFKVRREAIAPTIKVYPLRKGDSVYGAIISGDHYFYNQQKGQKEIRAGIAKFSNLWLLKDGSWKMARVLSYDHGPAPYLNTRKAIVLPTSTLSQYAGTYTGTKAGELRIKKDNNVLYVLTNGQKMALRPETKNRFFLLDRDLTFEFIKNQGNAGSKLVVRENGEVVEEAVLLRK